MAEKNLYDILEINENDRKKQGAEFEKILKKQFRKLCLKYHPDKHINDSEEEKKIIEDKFKEINEANEILSDPKKRQQYDLYGTIGSNNAGDEWGGMWSDFMNPFGRQRVVRGRDIKIKLYLTLEEIYNGGDKTIEYHKNVTCPQCNGVGGEHTVCPICGGTGVHTMRHQSGYTTYVEQRPCPNCVGRGYQITKQCPHCNGAGTIKEKGSKVIQIPKGVAREMYFHYQQEGEAPIGQSGVNGDLIIFVEEKEHEIFTRVNNNLYQKKTILFIDGLVGTDVTLQCIDGKEIKFNIKPLTPNGKTFKFSGKGMPIMNGFNQYGDMIVEIDYEMPTEITDEQKELLEKFKEIELSKNK